MLQKIETFSGREARWRDWPVVFRAAAGAAIPGLGAKLQKIELEPNEVLNVDMEPDEADRSSQLYFMLVLVCRDRALDVVINAGEQEGYEAWRQLALRYGGRERTGYAGQLVGILGWDFSGDLEQRLEAFEREVFDYAKSGNTLSDAMKIGIVTRNAPAGDLKSHIVLNAERLDTWSKFRAEIASVRRRRTRYHTRARCAEWQRQRQRQRQEQGQDQFE